jgi:hypothetical protein
MNIFVFKIVVIIYFLNYSIFADKGPRMVIEPFEKITKDTNKAGMVRTKKRMHDGNYNFESITTIHDKKGKLMFSRNYIFRDGLLAQTVENNVVRNVVYDDNACKFKVIEPSGNTTSFHLDPKKEPELPLALTEKGDSINFFQNLKVPPKDKYYTIMHIIWSTRCIYSIGFY